MPWRGTGRTHTGLIRTTNQDAFAVKNHIRLWVVADGMGGHAGGGVASQVAVNSFVEFVEKLSSSTSTLPPCPSPSGTLSQAMTFANQAVLDRARQQPSLHGMGTTIVALLISESPTVHATIAHVGDSRAYLVQEGSLSQLTRDHTWIQKQIRQGKLTPEQAKTHPLRHMLTRAIGTNLRPSPDITTIGLFPDDRLLLCTDGLNKMLDDERINQIIQANSGNMEKVCEQLIQESNRRGGEDNVTVLIIGEEKNP